MYKPEIRTKIRTFHISYLDSDKSRKFCTAQRQERQAICRKEKNRVYEGVGGLLNRGVEGSEGPRGGSTWKERSRCALTSHDRIGIAATSKQLSTFYLLSLSLFLLSFLPFLSLRLVSLTCNTRLPIYGFAG